MQKKKAPKCKTPTRAKAKKNKLTAAHSIPPTNKRFSEEVWLTMQEVCTTLGICYRTLCNWCIRGILPYYKIAGEIRFAETEVSERIKEYRRTGKM
jgi:excisionase family DNA binding protein